MLIICLIAGSASGGPRGNPTQDLARARAYLEAGREDLAEQYARRAAEADEESGEAFLLLGMLLSRREDGDGAARALLRAAALRPEDRLAREHLARALRGAYPTGLEENLFRALPGERTRGELTLTDPRLGLSGTPARAWTVIEAAPSDTAPAHDPKYRRAYPRVAYAYLLQERPRRWFRVATVRFTTSADAALARRVATLIAQLSWIRREYWSSVPDFPRPLETTLWLARDGRAGGEEWQGQIYLYDVAHERSNEEWVRQVMHEYGHVALPGQPIYTDPEPKANGYLGERLLAKWLRDNGATLWDGTVDLERYIERRVAPVQRRFVAEGPRSPLRSRRDRAGMEYYIGSVLAWEAAYGPVLLRAALAASGGQGAERFLEGCQKAVEEHAGSGMELSGEAFAVAGGGAANDRDALWLYLPAGGWRLEVEVRPGHPLAATWDGRPLVPTPAEGRLYFTLRRSEAGWHRLAIASGRAGVRRMAVVRSEKRDRPEGAAWRSLRPRGVAQAGAVSISRS